MNTVRPFLTNLSPNFDARPLLPPKLKHSRPDVCLTAILKIAG
jgi:hypothetical protein